MPLQNAKVTPRGRIPVKTEGTKPVLADRNPEGVKSKVKVIAPREDRCIIQNRNFSVELCHVFARCNSLDNEMMTAIEFHLGVEQNSMYLDSRWNCLFASNEFHAAFDRGLWGLIPKLDILKKYMDATESDVDSHDGYGKYLNEAMKQHDLDLEKGTGQEFHSYTFLAFDPAIDGSITQYNMEGSSAKDNMQMYPFNEPLIEVKSHVHPKYVILSLGQMLAKGRIPQRLRAQEHIQDFQPHLALIMELYKLWIANVQDSQLKAAENDFHPCIISPPPGISKAARYDNQSYRPGLNARVTNEDKAITRRNPPRLNKGAAVKDAAESEELRGRSVVPPRSASTNNRSYRDPSPAGRIPSIELPEDLASILNAVDGAVDYEDDDCSANISTSNADRTERTPSPGRQREPIKAPALLASYVRVNDNNPADGFDNEEDGSTPRANRTRTALSPGVRQPKFKFQAEAMNALVYAVATGCAKSIHPGSNDTQSMESPFPAIEHGKDGEPLDDASDSDGDQLPVCHSKERNHQGKGLKRQASNEPNLNDTPHSNSSTSSSLSAIPDHLLSPSPAGPIIPTMLRAPAIKRLRR